MRSFLRQCEKKSFAVERPKFNATTLAAMEEAKRISRDADIKGLIILMISMFLKRL
ncbi:hypothetical protein HMPREF9554_02774, partial [Treponema phagedenis F0421]